MVRIGPFDEVAISSWRVVPNQVLSSFASSFDSICLRMEVQISVIVRADFHKFSTAVEACGKPGAGSICELSALSHQLSAGGCFQKSG